jgi:hypothetical protein
VHGAGFVSNPLFMTLMPSSDLSANCLLPLRGVIRLLAERRLEYALSQDAMARHLSVTARAFSTLDLLCGGRATLGISVGDSALKAMRLPISKVDDFALALRTISALLAGRRVKIMGGDDGDARERAEGADSRRRDRSANAQAIGRSGLWRDPHERRGTGSH